MFDLLYRSSLKGQHDVLYLYRSIRRFSPLLSCYLVIHSLNLLFDIQKAKRRFAKLTKYWLQLFSTLPKWMKKKNQTCEHLTQLLFGRQIIKVRLSLISVFTGSYTKPGSCFWWQIILFCLKCLSVFQWNQCLSNASLAAMYASALWNMSAREIKGCSWRRPSVELLGIWGGGFDSSWKPCLEVIVEIMLGKPS